MNFRSEHETEVSIDVGGYIFISQPGECLNCGKSHSNHVTFSPHRARLIAAALVELADMAESENQDET